MQINKRQYTNEGKLTLLTLALSSALAAMMPASGYAQTQTISGTTTTTLPWNSGNVQIDRGGLISASSSAVVSAGTVGTLVNNGSIVSGYVGIYNDGSTIQSLINNTSGTITGFLGILNIASRIETISNLGLISASAGIINDAQNSIGTLINSGTINNGSRAINNQGGIGTMINSGFITGSFEAVRNDGTIGTLINNGGFIYASGSGGFGNGGINNDGLIDSLINNGGTISGPIGISNGGTINVLLNNRGTITGNDTGINLAGTIGSLLNSGGVISGGTIGIYSNSSVNALVNGNGGTIIGGNTGLQNVVRTIGMVSNAGTISGSNYGIRNDSNIGTLNNSGLIRGGNTALFLGLYSTLGSFTNSGTIAGNVVDNTCCAALTIYGGSGRVFGILTGSSGGLGVNDIGLITRNGDLVFGSGNQLLNDHVNVNSGAGTVSNAGVLQVNNQVTITGNYHQSTAASLMIGVSGASANANLTDTGSGRLLVNGDATFDAGATVGLVRTAGYFLARGQRYVVAAASGTLTGTGLNFSAGNFAVTGSIQRDSSDPAYTDLVLTLGGAVINNATNGNAQSSLGGLFKYAGTDAALLGVYNPAAAIETAQEANRVGAQLSPSQVHGAAMQAQTAANQAIGNATNERMDSLRSAPGTPAGSNGVATGEATRDIALWGQVFGGAATQGLHDGVAGYRANYRGLLIGGDAPVGERWRAGALVSAGKTAVSSDGDNSGSGANVNNYGVTTYATLSGAPWYINLQAGLAHQQYSTTRAISYPGFSGTANGSFNGWQYTGALQAGYPLYLDAWLPGAILTPMAGLSYSTVRLDGYTETGGNGAALRVSSSSANSLKSELGARLERSVDTSYGKLVPSLQLGWRHEYRDGRVLTGASFAADNTGATAFVTQGATPVANVGMFNLGVTLLQGKTLSLTARYALESGGGYTAQTASMQARWLY